MIGIAFAVLSALLLNARTGARALDEMPTDTINEPTKIAANDAAAQGTSGGAGFCGPPGMGCSGGLVLKPSDAGLDEFRLISSSTIPSASSTFNLYEHLPEFEVAQTPAPTATASPLLEGRYHAGKEKSPGILEEEDHEQGFRNAGESLSVLPKQEQEQLFSNGGPTEIMSPSMRFCVAFVVVMVWVV